ncbi:putative MarR family transcriptional regulator [Gordonia effusa NBRC 100432]|uniref:Putative MarR family transcriptional regulator n=1 Tax=Gordonia effusa NBRC 100432 TaxID=1077974 RepID=H0QWD0_9ACTN|nr:MarR family transcriptional regulator [Gordonia effusa]GAB17131.1 putative MarR family transcriptional regulator [Gordonia effusa NBRC 100432]
MRTHIDSDELARGNSSAAWSMTAAFAAAVDANLDRWLSENYRIGLTDYRALASLSREADKELRIAELAQRVGLTSTSTTRLVSRLESKSLARRDVCEDDGRGVYAVIDDAGEALLREVRDPYDARVRELLTDPGKHFPQIDAGIIATALSQVTTLLHP